MSILSDGTKALEGKFGLFTEALGCKPVYAPTSHGPGDWQWGELCSAAVQSGDTYLRFIDASNISKTRRMLSGALRL